MLWNIDQQAAISHHPSEYSVQFRELQVSENYKRIEEN